MNKIIRLLIVPVTLAAFVSTLAAQNVLRIGYQKSGAFLLVRAEGTLEKKLAPLGYTVEWREFSSGPPILEALNDGRIDIGHSGDAPLVFAQAHGVPFLYIGETRVSPDGVAILVPGGSSIRTPADLRGKKVAFAKGSSAHYLVARALLKAGLTFSDITPVYLSPPDARAAFESGAIDAWAVWDPYYAAAEVDANARALVNGEGLQAHREFYFGRTDFLEKHPEIIAPLLEVLEASGQKEHTDPKGTAAFLADKLGIPYAILERTELRKGNYGGIPFDAAGAAEQQEVADTFFKIGLIPEKLNVADAVYHTAPAK